MIFFVKRGKKETIHVKTLFILQPSKNRFITETYRPRFICRAPFCRIVAWMIQFTFRSKQACSFWLSEATGSFKRFIFYF